jgi:hypothetical protein
MLSAHVTAAAVKSSASSLLKLSLASSIGRKRIGTALQPAVSVLGSGGGQRGFVMAYAKSGSSVSSSFARGRGTERGREHAERIWVNALKIATTVLLASIAERRMRAEQGTLRGILIFFGLFRVF